MVLCTNKIDRVRGILSFELVFGGTIRKRAFIDVFSEQNLEQLSVLAFRDSSTITVVSYYREK